MRNRVLTFFIGVLVGAIITTTVFLIYSKINKVNDFAMPPMMMQGEGGMRPGGEGRGRGEFGGMNQKMPKNPNNNVENVEE